MPCKFLLVLVARLERFCRRSTFSGQNLSSSIKTSVTKKNIKNSTGTIITSCSYTRISEEADQMFARNMSVKFDIFSAYNFGDSCLMLMMPVFYLADLMSTHHKMYLRFYIPNMQDWTRSPSCSETECGFKGWSFY